MTAVIRVDDEVEVGRQVLRLLEEFLGVCGEAVGGAGIDQQQFDPFGRELGGVGFEVMGLALAVGALVAGIAAQDDEDDRALFQQTAEADSLAFWRGEGEGRGRGTDGGRLGCMSARSGRKKSCEGDEQRDAACGQMHRNPPDICCGVRVRRAA